MDVYDERVMALLLAVHLENTYPVDAVAPIQIVDPAVYHLEPVGVVVPEAVGLDDKVTSY